MGMKRSPRRAPMASERLYFAPPPMLPENRVRVENCGAGVRMLTPRRKSR